MSYCVNCGVELDEGEKKCPLCATAVLNPNKPFDETAKPAYPDSVKQMDIVQERKMTALLISAVIALPLSICLVCNYILSHTFNWSIYVLISLSVVWVVIVPPFLIRRGTLLWCISLDVMALGVFLYVINKITTPNEDWFRPLAMPLLLAGAVLVLVLAFVFKYAHLTKLYNAAVCYTLVGVLLVDIEIITDSYLGQPTGLNWSPLAMVPCVLFALLHVLVERKKHWKSIMKKKLHM